MQVIVYEGVGNDGRVHKLKLLCFSKNLPQAPVKILNPQEQSNVGAGS